MKSAQQGMALIEALLASAVLGIGLLGATQLTLKALQTATDTRQRHAAHMLAQEAMDCALSGTPTCPSQDSVQVQGTRYSRQMRVVPHGVGLNDVEVTVQWASSVTSASSGSSPQSPSGLASLTWRSSVSSVPRWVGVSSP